MGHNSLLLVPKKTQQRWRIHYSTLPSTWQATAGVFQVYPGLVPAVPKRCGQAGGGQSKGWEVATGGKAENWIWGASSSDSRVAAKEMEIFLL